MRRRGIDGIMQALQPDASLHQRADQFHEMPERTAQAVQFPDDQHISGPDIAAIPREPADQPAPLTASL